MKKLLLGICFGLLSCTQVPTKNTKTEYTGLGKESVSAKEIAEYAPAKLDPQVERQIREMLDISSPGAGVLAPNKKQLFFTWKVTGVHQIWTIDSQKNFPIQLTGGKDSNQLDDITADGKWLVITQDKDGAENPGIYLLSPDGAVRKTVYENPKVRAFVASIPRDSKSLYYGANDEQPDSNTFYRYDFATGQREKIFFQPGQWFIADSSRDSSRWLMVKALTNTAREYYEFNLKTKVMTPLLGQGEEEEYRAVWAKNEKDLIVATSKFENFKRLYLLKGKEWKEIFVAKEGEVDEFGIDEPRHRILIQTNEAAYFKVHALDAETYKPIEVPSFPKAEQVFARKTTWDGDVTNFSVSTAQSPQTTYSYNWKTKAIKQWNYPSAPGIDLSKFAKVTLEYYPAKDGTQIPMFVRRPEACAKKLCPVVVSFHGGPEGQSIPGFNIRAQIFVNAGFIYVEPNVRGSDGYGKKWFHSDDRAKRLDVITDIEDCSIFIKRKWQVNGVAPKVGVIGGSYGGYSTLMAMTRFAGAYDAGVSIVGMSNLVSFLQNTAPYRRALRTPEYGDLVKDHDALVKLSPVTYIDQLKSPLMIIQGVNDPRVPVGEALQIQKTLEAKKIPSKLILFADEGHGAEKKDNQALELGHALDFLKKYLL